MNIGHAQPRSKKRQLGPFKSMVNAAPGPVPTHEHKTQRSKWGSNRC